MLYIIDFDDTLFDRSGRFAKACSKAGIDFQGPLYQQAKQNNIYHPKLHLKLLGKPYSDLQRIIARGQEFLFPGTVEKLKQLSQHNQLILLSKGEFQFQKEKIRHSGIEKFFDKVYITEKSKTKVLQEKILAHYSAKNIVFIDDKEEEVQAIKALYPRITTSTHL